MLSTAFSSRVCLSVLILPLSFCFYVPNQSSSLPFDDQVRERHLYTESKRQGLFLEIAPDGSVSGAPTQKANSVLELRSVRPGETVIKGVASSLYLCVDSAGHLRGQSQYKEADCTFRELLLSNGYTLFLSPHRGLPVSLSSRHTGQKQSPPFSHFLPVKNQLLTGVKTVEKEPENQRERPENMNLESDDPLGMLLSPVDSYLSPGFLS